MNKPSLVTLSLGCSAIFSLQGASAAAFAIDEFNTGVDGNVPGFLIPFTVPGSDSGSNSGIGNKAADRTILLSQTDGAGSTLLIDAGQGIININPGTGSTATSTFTYDNFGGLNNSIDLTDGGTNTFFSFDFASIEGLLEFDVFTVNVDGEVYDATADINSTLGLPTGVTGPATYNVDFSNFTTDVTSVESIEFVMQGTSGSDFSFNFFSAGQIPEPSVFLLSAFSLLGLARRNRQQV